MYRRITFAVLLALLPVAPVWAKKPFASNDLVLESSSALPELARPQSQGMVLDQPGNGRTYLYLEQQQLKRLVVLDVTDPAHITCLSSARLNAPATFDFVSSIGDSEFLVRFHDDYGSAVLDFRNPKAPSLKKSDVFGEAGSTESLGNGDLMTTDEPALEGEMSPHDYKIINASNPGSPNLVATIRSVREKVENPETGTLFLLGEDGLTVVRHPHIEDEHRALENIGN